MEEPSKDGNEKNSTPIAHNEATKEEHGKEIETSSKSSEAPKGEEKKTDYNEKSTLEPKFGDYIRVFGYSTILDRVILAGGTAAQMGTGVTLPLMIIVFGNLVGAFSDPSLSINNFKSTLNTQALYLVYLFIGRYCLSYLGMLSYRTIGLRMSAKIRFEYLNALFHLPISVLDTIPTGQTANTITATANILQVGISEKLGTLIQFSTLMIAAIIVAFVYSWRLTLACSSVLLFIGLVYGTTIPLVVKMTKEVDHANEKASSIAGEAIASIRMIIASSAEGRVATKYAGWIEESRRRGRKQDLIQGVIYSPLFFAIYAVFALAFWFGFKLKLQGYIDNVGDIMVVLMNVMMVTFSLGQTAPPIQNIVKAVAAASDFYAVIDAPKPNIHGLKDPEVSPQSDITLDSVTFAYPSRPHNKILDDLSLRFEAGKITAIVGSSGSGKSTIVGLLERWYELNDFNKVVIPKSAIKDDKEKKEEEDAKKGVKAAEVVEEESKPPISLSGTIRVGEHSLDSLDLKWWRSQIGLVQQEPFIFNDTIYKNVEYGLIGSQWENESPEKKRELVLEACREAFADEYITRLPQGYETPVGDAGIKLSGGQRQRLAIARAIIKRPTILILDEATSAIDVRGERLVQAALDKVSEGRTTITIAHRLSTIKKADKIIVLKKGKVVEEGNHESLLNNPDGAYFALVNAQKLTMGENFAAESDLEEQTKAETLAKIMSTASAEAGHADETAAYQPKGLVKSFGLLLSEQKSQFIWYICLLVGCMGAATAYPVQAYIFANIIGVMSLSDAEVPSASSHWALMFLILAIGIGLSYFIMGATANAISVNIACTYRQQYLESIIAKPVSFYDKEENSAGTLVSRVSNDPTQLQQLLGINSGMILIAFLGMIACSIIGFVYGWKLTILTLCVVAPVVIGAGYFRIRYELQFEAMNQAVFAESSKFAAESISAFRTVTALTLEGMICSRYEVLLQEHVDSAFKKSRWTVLLFALSDSISVPCMALVFWYGGQLIIRGEYSQFEFFVVYMAVFNGAEQIGSLLSFGPNAAMASAAANRILSFRVRDEETTKGTLELQDTTGGVDIEFKDVWFKYPTRDIPIFTGLNLSIKRGQFAALVGPSGCGKTSIISLLERFYGVQKGQILANGTPITDLNIHNYRQSMSLVAQEPTLFQGTIRENILLGVDPSTPDSLLYKACRDAEIHDFILSLPEGYNTDVGNKGVSLSGGQKQRISIARALIRDPKVLLLDEATSSLDSESEKLVQAAFERAAEGRTMVVVAHRLATVQNADIIFVLGEGKVLEVGTHQSLLKMRGVYYQMCQSQALDR